MRKNRLCFLTLFLGAICSGPGWAGTVDDRINERLDYYIAHPWPDANSTDPATAAWGKAGYALATLKRYPARGNLATAQGYINDLCAVSIPQSTMEFPTYFMLPMLVRMYMDPALNQYLTEENKTKLEDTLWSFTNYRSNVNDPLANVWRIKDSENHDVIQKSMYFLTCQMLYNNPRYGPTKAIYQGSSLGKHLTSWRKWFFEYFRQRAREGLNCEIASGYNKFTVGCWLNIADLLPADTPENIALKELARKTVDLFWADYGVDFLPLTGTRAASGTRWYHDSIDDPTGSDILYCYNWTEVVWNLHPFNMIYATSPYRQPAIVQLIGGDPSRTPYLATTRRFGKGGERISSDYPFFVLFGPDHASDISRQTWWHPNYVLGGLTLRTDKPDDDPGGYTKLIDQDRALGVYFSTHWADRIVFHGWGTYPGHDGISYTDVTGLAGKRCLIASRDKNYSWNQGSRLYVTNSLYNTKVDNQGWIFMKVGAGLPTETYAGIRICNNGYTVNTTPGTAGGKMVDFNDDNAPVIIEVATPGDLPAGANTFEWFQVFCVNQWNTTGNYNPTAKTVTYTSLAGDTYVYPFADNTALPMKNGITVNLNPPQTYDSPYVKMDHGDDEAMLAYYDDRSQTTFTTTLDFNYKDAPLWDDYQTKALWHMEAVASGKVADDDLENASRNNDLMLYGGATLATSGGVNTLMANSLNLNGVDGYAASTIAWPPSASVKVDFWFHPTRDQAADQVLITAVDTWNIRTTGSDVNFTIWDNAGGTPTLTLPGTATLNAWHHVTATVWMDGRLSLKVDEAVTTRGAGAPMRAQSAPINLGNRAGTTCWFKGRIDDVKIRTMDLRPQMITQSVGGTFAPGQPVSLSVAASGGAPFFYQWRKDNVNIPGATAANYTIPASTESDEGVYTCLITNGAGTLTSAAATVVVTGVVWVDFAYAGAELGTPTLPFNTLGEGVASVVSGGTLELTGGTESAERLRISKPLRIEAIGGPARIGVGGP